MSQAAPGIRARRLGQLAGGAAAASLLGLGMVTNCAWLTTRTGRSMGDEFGRKGFNRFSKW